MERVGEFDVGESEVGESEVGSVVVGSRVVAVLDGSVVVPLDDDDGSSAVAALEDSMAVN